LIPHLCRELGLAPPREGTAHSAISTALQAVSSL